MDFSGKKKFGMIGILVLVVLLVCALIRLFCGYPILPEHKTIIGVGYVRGMDMVMLKNKYGAFIRKVHFFTGDAVKKGDVILEYDDYDWRVKLKEAEHDVAEQRKDVAIKTAALALTATDPLPSQYHNAKWKMLAAEGRFRRLKHEADVYRRLHGYNIVSDISYREKMQDMEDAEATFKSQADDIQLISSGLAKLYIAQAQKELENEETILADLEEKLKLVQEDGQYYKIVAPIDGIVENNSDTVAEYNPAGTEAAEVHNFDKGTRVYCFFDERDIGYVTEGGVYRFRSNSFDCDKFGFPTVTPTRVKKSHSSYGDRSLYQVECTVLSTPKPLKMNSTGQIEIEVPVRR